MGHLENRSAVRCLLVEDSNLWSPGLERQGIEVVARATTFDEVAPMVALYRPDVIFADLGIPGVCRYDTVAAIRQVVAHAAKSEVVPSTASTPPDDSQEICPVVAYSVQMTIQSAVWCLAAGALAAVNATDPLPLFGEALRRAAAGKPTIEPYVAQWILDVDQTRSERDPERQGPIDGELRSCLETIADGDVYAEDTLITAIHEMLPDLFLDEDQRAAVEAVARTAHPAATAEALGIRPERVADLLASSFPILFPGRGYEEFLPGTRQAARVAAWAKEDHHCPHCPAEDRSAAVAQAR